MTWLQELGSGVDIVQIPVLESCVDRVPLASMEERIWKRGQELIGQSLTSLWYMQREASHAATQA